MDSDETFQRLEQEERMPTDIAKIQAELAAIDAKIAPLKAQREQLQNEYSTALMAELERITGTRVVNQASPTQRRTRKRKANPAGSAGPSAVDDAAIIKALERAQIPITVGRLRELADIGDEVSSPVLSGRLKELAQAGKIKKEGERRSTTYQIA